jgi:hypothetical protein
MSTSTIRWDLAVLCCAGMSEREGYGRYGREICRLDEMGKCLPILDLLACACSNM